MELRDYQKDLINNIRNEIMKEKRTICAVLGAVFESLVEFVSTKWLIEHRYLAPYKYYGAFPLNICLNNKRGRSRTGPALKTFTLKITPINVLQNDCASAKIISDINLAEREERLCI